ncbi:MULTISPECIES: efflux RND transporter periplasmic adaptor subunit [unclassified Mucilaginibacter]|uniref:efflux RND transporter periplasmic adaptor subunit n=1 Tax=unclassified Mucilaginibacter TaxID=2617802 RepID=UPI002AC9088E|nr:MULTISPECIES: efflux RND transporter periplasmic adaptor subunit [unclassified Mucilaginibacter]MEB0260143.1 efflux RND transporter periplasmic adaptor subunit [Mucilaginibacter sp. 10I4]MEB0279136.1 efflux RND transporter periplasmic adaptor subunit [Mucilaginibacter sp. 10B2]MEB0302924.1 efflux RND transporter periplasmic adaptor subunit [Mucilaginibacter sp. 5C4]WPX22314.1 efflux RND transporter periplasmic adaptor subunit [Mucilaginibacter sp. 5C4]
MKNRYTYTIAAIALITISSCGDKKSKDAAAAQPPTPVNVVEAKKADAIYYDKYQGTVTALNSVELRSQVGGFITGIFFKEGDVVQKGKPLYEIDRRKYVAAYEQAKANLLSANANLSKAQKDIDRYNMLLKNDAVARQTVDQATASYEISRSQVAVAQAGVESAATDLSYATIRAPFTGRIGISQVKLGAQVSPGTTLLNTISTGNPIGVDVVINEQDINRFYKLQKASTDITFLLQTADGTIFNKPGKVFAIDRGVSDQTGTIKVRIQFPNADDQLKDGMSCVLQVLNDNSGDRVQIPYKAITEQMGEFFVFVSQDTIAKQVKVQLGPRIQSNVVIMDGVKPGDKIITEGFQRLRDGGKITLGPPAGAGGAPAAK